MAFTQLKTNYVDDVLDTSVNSNIVYIETDLSDSSTRNITLQDATVYTTLGDQLSASVLNGIGTVVNAIGTQVTSNTTICNNVKEGKINLDTSAQSGTVDGDLYAAITALNWQSYVIV